MLIVIAAYSAEKCRLVLLTFSCLQMCLSVQKQPLREGNFFFHVEYYSVVNHLSMARNASQQKDISAFSYPGLCRLIISRILTNIQYDKFVADFSSFAVV